MMIVRSMMIVRPMIVRLMMVVRLSGHPLIQDSLRECLDIEGGLMEPGGVVGDEGERAETDLAALCQSSAGKHDQVDRKNRNFSN